MVKNQSLLYELHNNLRFDVLHKLDPYDENPFYGVFKIIYTLKNNIDNTCLVKEEYRHTLPFTFFILEALFLNYSKF